MKTRWFHHISMQAFLSLILMMTLATGCLSPSDQTRYEQTRPQMGTLFTITLYAYDDLQATNAFNAAFARIEELNMIFSDYEDESEITILRKSANSLQPKKISPELLDVLQRSKELYEQTDGAFDPTLGLMIQHWRRARRQRTLPKPETIAKVRKKVGFDKLELDAEASTARITTSGLMLDFGGIAKGYAADEALRTLNQHGVYNALIAASGDILAGDPPPGQDHWTVGVQSTDVSGENFTTVLNLANQAVSTSGDASQYALIKGRKYSHIVDPRTGIGLTERIGVTITAPNATTSDSLATAVSILGSEKGMQLVESLPNVESLIVKETNDGDVFLRIRSSDFTKTE